MTLNPKFANWMQAVEATGYRTSLFGKTHLHRHNRDLRNDLPLMHALGLQVVNETTGPPGNARVLSEMTTLWEERGYWDAYKAYMEEQSGDAHCRPKPPPLPLELYYDDYVPQQAKRYIRKFAVTEFEEFHVMVTDRWKVEFNKRLRPTLLIDRRNDPGELIDLSHDRSLKPVVAELAEIFEVFLSETPSYDGVVLARRPAA